jgi:hypothetical protein
MEGSFIRIKARRPGGFSADLSPLRPFTNPALRCFFGKWVGGLFGGIFIIVSDKGENKPHIIYIDLQDLIMIRLLLM